jgi:hypothetical protein
MSPTATLEIVRMLVDESYVSAAHALKGPKHTIKLNNIARKFVENLINFIIHFIHFQKNNP